jgi:hypothetical protein
MVAPAAASLIKALGIMEKKEVVQSTKNFASGMKEMKEAGQSGVFEQFNNMMSQTFSPTGTLHRILTAKVNAGTIDAKLKLFDALNGFIESPAGERSINALNSFLSTLVNSSAKIVEATTSASNYLLETQQETGLGTYDPTALFILSVQRLFQDRFIPASTVGQDRPNNISDAQWQYLQGMGYF